MSAHHQVKSPLTISEMRRLTGGIRESLPLEREYVGTWSIATFAAMQ
jgi:hypothetical protein